MSNDSENETMNASANISTNRNDPGFWRDAWQQARLVFYLLTDAEVPFYLKLLPFLSFLYFLSPIDLIPAAIMPVVGSLDDITILLVGAKVFVELAPQHVVIRHLNHIRAQDGYSPIAEDSQENMPDDDQDIIEGEIIIEEKDPA